jgi:hypothetical protein
VPLLTVWRYFRHWTTDLWLRISVTEIFNPSSDYFFCISSLVFIFASHDCVHGSFYSTDDHVKLYLLSNGSFYVLIFCILKSSFLCTMQKTRKLHATVDSTSVWANELRSRNSVGTLLNSNVSSVITEIKSIIKNDRGLNWFFSFIVYHFIACIVHSALFGYTVFRRLAVSLFQGRGKAACSF